MLEYASSSILYITIVIFLSEEDLLERLRASLRLYVTVESNNEGEMSIRHKIFTTLSTTQNGAEAKNQDFPTIYPTKDRKKL